MRASQGILEHWRIHHQDVEERVCLNLNVSVHTDSNRPVGVFEPRNLHGFSVAVLGHRPQHM